MYWLVLTFLGLGCELLNGSGNPGAQDFTDNDGDGFAVETGDCDDSNDRIHPDATEVCNNIDDNCSGEVDEGTLVDFFADEDADGFGVGSPRQACEVPTGFAAVDGDCDDTDHHIHPGAMEVCDEAFTDEDCNGLANASDPGIADATAWYRDPR